MRAFKCRPAKPPAFDVPTAKWSLEDLKDFAHEWGITPAGDKRKKSTWLSAILAV